MKVGRWVGFFHRLVVRAKGEHPTWGPTPPHPSWIPAFAGMTNGGPD